MDWKIFLTVFGTVFMAELGDKTQLATFFFSAQGGRPATVFAASALALVLASLMAVVLGQAASMVIPEKALTGIAGGAFIVIGVLMVGSVMR